MSPSKVCVYCRKAVATAATVCTACAAVVAVEDAGASAGPVQVVAARQEAGERPHTDLMEPRFEAEKILTYTTSSPPRISSLFGWDVVRSVDPERTEEPHTAERDADPVLLNAAYAVTGNASSAADASAATEPVTPFMNRAARRAAERQQRRHQGRPRATPLHG